MKREVQNTLQEMYERDGSLHPAKVVDEARDQKSPLHDLFDWDDKKAGEAFRIGQARQLIRVAVKVIPNISNRPVREFISVSSLRKTGTGSYLGTVEVMGDEALRKQALSDAIKTLQGFANRYAHFAELHPVFDAIAELTTSADAA